jgi:nucleoside permease NupC
MERFSALIGFVLILAIAFALSNNKKSIRWKTVGWGLLLQILTAICVLKGEQIAALFAGFRPSLTVANSPLHENAGAAIFFILLSVVMYFVAGRVAQPGRNYLWYGFGVVSLYLFLAFNLLKFLFENLKEVVNKLIGYTGEGSKFVFGPLGDDTSSVGFVFACRVLPTIIFIA